MSTVLLDRHRVRVSGAGPLTMVFAHGFGTTQQSWRAQVAAFRDSYRVVRFDLAGALRTDAPGFDMVRYASLTGYVDDLLEILAALDLGDVIYVGHSMSGMIGLLAARAQPARFQHLICISTSPRYLNEDGYVGGFTQADLDTLYTAMAQDYGRWALSFAPQMMGVSEQPQLVRDFYRSLRTLSPAIAQLVVRTIFQSDYRAILPEVPTPTLLLQSTDDPAVPPSVGQYLVKALPRATLHEIAGSGHFPQLSAPESVNSAIYAYLNQEYTNK